MPENIHLVYMTAATREEAAAIGEALVAAKLAACVNIIGEMQSIFMWEGKLEHATEAVLIAKTTAGRVPELVERVRAMHSYDCPCIVTLPVSDGNPAFLDWIAGTVRP